MVLSTMHSARQSEGMVLSTMPSAECLVLSTMHSGRQSEGMVLSTMHSGRRSEGMVLSTMHSVCTRNMRKIYEGILDFTTIKNIIITQKKIKYHALSPVGGGA
jgi:hypothetical protein